MEVAALLADAHGRALRLVSAHGGRHYQGLGQASRALKTMPSSLRRRMAHLDVAFSFVRHVTSPLVDSFLAELAQHLAELNPENCDTGVAAPTTCSGDLPLAPPRPDFGCVSGVSASLGAAPREHAHTFADGSPPSSPYPDVVIVPGVPVGPVSDSALEHVHIISDLPGRGRSPARRGRRLPPVPRLPPLPL